MNVNLTLSQSDINGVLGALALQIAETTDPVVKLARVDRYDRIMAASGLRDAAKQAVAKHKIENAALSKIGADAVKRALADLNS